MFNKVVIISTLLLSHGMVALGESKIFLIRHAKVNLESEHWGTARIADEYKQDYNLAGIVDFNPQKVAKKIPEFETTDTVYCSPQYRALKTAMLLVDENTIIKACNALEEIDYSVAKVPIVQLPISYWLTLSRIIYLKANKIGKTYLNQRQKELTDFYVKIDDYSKKHRNAIVIAHGMVNRQLVLVLRRNGWKRCRDSDHLYKNLSVICLEK